MRLLLSPKDFLPGDRLESGTTIRGYMRLAKGGMSYLVEPASGDEPRELVFDGRRKYRIIREETTTP